MTTQDPDDSAVSQIPADDYDSPWKEAVEHYFPELLAFYFPAAYAQIRLDARAGVLGSRASRRGAGC